MFYHSVVSSHPTVTICFFARLGGATIDATHCFKGRTIDLAWKVFVVGRSQKPFSLCFCLFTLTAVNMHTSVESATILFCLSDSGNGCRRMTKRVSVLGSMLSDTSWHSSCRKMPCSIMVRRNSVWHDSIQRTWTGKRMFWKKAQSEAKKCQTVDVPFQRNWSTLVYNTQWCIAPNRAPIQRRPIRPTNQNRRNHF